MPMPNNLILVRHGESEGNVASRQLRRGEIDGLTDEFKERPGHNWHLTPRGIEQAKSAGVWIGRFVMSQIGGIDRFYVSPHNRTRETAGYLAIQDAMWMQTPRLRERDWGDIESMPAAEYEARYPDNARTKKTNSLYWRPPGGESIAQVGETRVQRQFETLHREAEGKSALMVTHGEFMWATSFELERMGHDDWTISEADASKRIRNCQVTHYTRIDPKTGEQSDRIEWVRSVCPWATPDSSGEWRHIELRKLTNEELLASIEPAN